MKWNFDITKVYTPDIKTLAENRHYLEECNRLGIITGLLASDDFFSYTKEELLAKKYLCQDKKLPPELEAYLLETKAERLSRINLNPNVDLTSEFDSIQV